MVDFSPERLRGLRDSQNKTREQLASEAGVSASTVKAWESGTAAPSARLLRDAATALQVCITDLARVHADPSREYISAALRGAPPLPDDTVDAVASILRRIRNRNADGSRVRDAG